MFGFSEVIFRIINEFVIALRRHPTFRNWALIICGLVIVVCLLTYYIIAPNYTAPETTIRIRENIPPLLLIVSLFEIVGILSLTSINFKLDMNDEELVPIRKEREEIQRRIENEPRTDILDTIQLSLNQITEYYTINKSQARRSFTFSVFAIILGIATLIGGIWLFYFGSSPNIQLATISGIAGLLIQFYGGANFYLYNKSLSQLNYFYDRLVKMQNTMLAIKLCEQIDDNQRQDDVREKLIFEIITAENKTTELALKN